MTNTHDDAGGDWVCLTPLTDDAGNLLTVEQRLQHCATVLGEIE